MDVHDGTTVWLASDPQDGRGNVMQIGRNLKLVFVERDVDVSGNIISADSFAAALPRYNTVTVWKRVNYDLYTYNVPSHDSRGTLDNFDGLSVDSQGTLWLRRQSRGVPTSLFALRSTDQQFVPVRLPESAYPSVDCGVAVAHTAHASYRIDPTTFELAKLSRPACDWEGDSFGIIHIQVDGTSKRLQLIDFSSWGAHMPLDLLFTVGPDHSAWVWARGLCRVDPSERVSCAPVQLGTRHSGTILFARDGTIWFLTSFQTLVHARFLPGQG